LNAVGWGAVALLCLTGAGLGFAAARLTGSTGEVAALAGAVLALIALVVADRRRWGRTKTSFSWGDDPEAVVRAGETLRRHGISVELETDHEGRPRLRYRNRDARKVRRAMTRAGVVLPPS
jgi:hypothetical protein